MTTAVPVLFCNGCLVVKLCRWDTRVTENSGEQCPWDWPHLTRAEITHSTLIGERQPIDLGTFDVGSLFIYKKESHVKNLDFKCSQKPGRFHKARGPHFFMHAVGWSQVSFLQKGHESPVHHSPHHSISSVTAYWLPLSFVLSVTSMLAFEGCGFVCVCVCLRVCLFLCFGQAALRILVPRPGIETVLPEVKVGVLTTESPGKSLTFEFWLLI